jgi:transposase-like protein
MATERRKYAEEFKGEAVQLMETRGKANAELARDLGINDNNLYRWRNLYGRQSEPTAKGNLTDMEAELKRLPSIVRAIVKKLGLGQVEVTRFARLMMIQNRARNRLRRFGIRWFFERRVVPQVRVNCARTNNCEAHLAVLLPQDSDQWFKGSLGDGIRAHSWNSEMIAVGTYEQHVPLWLHHTYTVAGG